MRGSTSICAHGSEDCPESEDCPWCPLCGNDTIFLMQRMCRVTGWTFEPMSEEMTLRRKLGIDGTPDLHPVFRFMLLGAFWQHWNLHKRPCSKTGNMIISVYPEDCPYLVWHKDEWLQHADPPGADVDMSKAVFPQLWSFFSRSPIAHNIGAGNENCEYTDDWWYSKNCYLCHSGVTCEDLRYCYRTTHTQDSQFCVFSFDSQRCVDLINCHTCFQVRYAQNCAQCSDGAFLYDCRNCRNCMFCCNLRSKQYCFENQQCSKEDYEQKAAAWELRSQQTYDCAKQTFHRMMRTNAWHRALFVEQSKECTGNYIDGCKNCKNCYFLSNDMRDCAHVLRGGVEVHDALDCLSAFKSELLYLTCCPQDQCSDVQFCCNVIQCKWMRYSMHCFQCEHCFGCCGLVGRKYHIFNRPCPPEEYEVRTTAMIMHMQKTGEYGKFFPASFAAVPYEETIAGFYWPLPQDRAKEFGFHVREQETVRPTDGLDPSEIPDRSDAADSTLTGRVFWDDTAKRPFQISATDVAFAQFLGTPLPSMYYARRLQENCRQIPFNGALQQVTCARCKERTHTSWPEEYADRILCETCYLQEVY